MEQFDRIRKEEMYRAEVRKQLELSTPKQSGVLAFFNTTFGIFLLSSVFISAFSWSFSALLTHERDRKEEHATVQKLGLEVMNRLRYLDELKEPFDYNRRHAIETSMNGFNSHANVNPSWIPHYSSVFPEYQERSFMSLIWELESHSKGNTLEQLKSAHKPIDAASPYLNKLEYKKVNAPGKNPEGVIETLGLSDDDRSKFDSEVLKPLAFLRDPAFFDKH